MTKRIPAALLAFSAASLFAEPIADFALTSNDIILEEKLIPTLAEVSRLERENRSGNGKPVSEYTVKDPEHKDIGLSGLDNRRTKKFLDYYLTAEGRNYLSKILYDSTEYRAYIREQLNKRKLPSFLQYLPIVESEYKANAVSVSGATGMWQFMENSMEPFLRKSEWYDERLDPWIETEAALSKLSDNYKMFGNWELALAAYNMGAGAIKKIRKNSTADFWMLADLELLSEQTILYVPKLIAIAEIIENAEYYGAIDIGVADNCADIHRNERYGKVKIKGSISLEEIAKRSETDLSLLKKLNPALIKGCTPPKEKWILRVPEGKAKNIAKSITK